MSAGGGEGGAGEAGAPPHVRPSPRTSAASRPASASRTPRSVASAATSDALVTPRSSAPVAATGVTAASPARSVATAAPAASNTLLVTPPRRGGAAGAAAVATPVATPSSAAVNMSVALTASPPPADGSGLGSGGGGGGVVRWSLADALEQADSLPHAANGLLVDTLLVLLHTAPAVEDQWGDTLAEVAADRTYFMEGGAHGGALHRVAAAATVVMACATGALGASDAAQVVASVDVGGLARGAVAPLPAATALLAAVAAAPWQPRVDPTPLCPPAALARGGGVPVVKLLLAVAYAALSTLRWHAPRYAVALADTDGGGEVEEEVEGGDDGDSAAAADAQDLDFVSPLARARDDGSDADDAAAVAVHPPASGSNRASSRAGGPRPGATTAAAASSGTEARIMPPMAPAMLNAWHAECERVRPRLHAVDAGTAAVLSGDVAPPPAPGAGGGSGGSGGGGPRGAGGSDWARRLAQLQRAAAGSVVTGGTAAALDAVAVDCRDALEVVARAERRWNAGSGDAGGGAGVARLVAQYGDAAETAASLTARLAAAQAAVAARSAELAGCIEDADALAEAVEAATTAMSSTDALMRIRRALGALRAETRALDVALGMARTRHFTAQKAEAAAASAAAAAAPAGGGRRGGSRGGRRHRGRGDDDDDDDGDGDGDDAT